MSVRYYANAPATTLAAACSSSATLVTVDSTAGLPIQYPFTLILDRGQSTEEAVSVTNVSGTSLTVARGIDGTTAFAHTIGATVEHGITAQDVREPNTHINADSGVHGVVGNVVGDSDTQALTNKDLSDATNVFPASLATDAEVAAVQTAATNAQSAADAAQTTADSANTLAQTNATNLTTHESDTTTHGATGAIVGTTNTQTLTNKNLSSSTNTFPGSFFPEMMAFTNKTTTSLFSVDTAVLAMSTSLDNGTYRLRGSISPSGSVAGSTATVSLVYGGTSTNVTGTVVAQTVVSFAVDARRYPVSLEGHFLITGLTSPWLKLIVTNISSGTVNDVGALSPISLYCERIA